MSHLNGFNDLNDLSRQDGTAPVHNDVPPPAPPDVLQRARWHWPSPVHAAASQGLAGERVDVIAPHAEADPVAVLLSFLTAIRDRFQRNVPSARIGDALSWLGGLGLAEKFEVGTAGEGRKAVIWRSTADPCQSTDFMAPDGSFPSYRSFLS